MQPNTSDKKTDSTSVKEEKMHNDNEFSSDVDLNYQHTYKEKLDMKEFASAIRKMGDQFYSHHFSNDEPSQFNGCSENIRQICTSYKTLMSASESEEFPDSNTSILQKISDEFYKHHCITDVASHSTEYGDNITKICAEYKSDLLNNIGTEYKIAGDELYNYKSSTIAEDNIDMQKFNHQSESYNNLLDEITLHVSKIGDVINDKLDIKDSSIDDLELQNETVSTNFSDGINNISAIDSANISHILG